MLCRKGHNGLKSLLFGIALVSFPATALPKSLQDPKSPPPVPETHQSQTPEFKVEVRLVQIEVRVRQDGRTVTDLETEDFTLKEDGAIQEIDLAEYVSDPIPRSVGAEPVTGGRLIESDPAPEDRAPDAAKPPHRTWVYLAPEVDNPWEFSRTAIAIEKFITEELRPGFLVSLGGLPFTGNRQLLLEGLRRMTAGPYGSGPEHPAGISPEPFHLSDVEFQREVALTLADQSAGLLSISSTEREPDFAGSLSDVPVMTVEAIDRQIAFFGHLALFRYLDLVERLAAYPGKKVVVLFRSGLRLDLDNYNDIQQLASAAQRHRVSFYTIDSRGLNAPLPVIDRAFALPFESGRRSPVPNLLGDYQRLAESMDGLVVLAKQTDGRAVTDTNNMGEVLDAVVEDASDYYILGYYPKTQREEGRFRKIQVEVRRPGVQVAAPKGYFERKSFESQTDKERVRSLRHALLETDAGELDVPTNLELFADDDGRPLVFFSVGVHLRQLVPRTHHKQQRLNASILAQLSDTLGQKLPIYHEHQLEQRLPLTRWQKALEDDTVFLTYNARIPVSPGQYQWKVVLRDENSGKLGVQQVSVRIPDFSRPSTPSSLLVTHQILTDPATPSGKNGSAGNGSSTLQAGGLFFTPQPSDVFPRGAPVYLLYDLYNPTPEEDRAAAAGMQLALFRNGRPVEGVQASGQPFVDRERGLIRYVAVIDTSRLEPGEYRILGLLPNHQNRKIPHLEETFTLVPVD